MHSVFRKGVSLLEVVVATSIFLLISLAVTESFSQYIRVSQTALPILKASYFLDEGFEVVRALRDTSWTTNISPLVNGTPYYFSWSGSEWSFTTTPALVDGLHARTVTFAPVYRDANKDIQSSGTLDSNTRMVTVAVAWRISGATTTRSVSGYITNMFQN